MLKSDGTLQIEVPQIARECLDQGVLARYRVLHGGRGGGKSWAVARVLIGLCFAKRLRILCTREFQKSIKDSVHRLLTDQIEAMGLGSYFEILQQEIKGPNGSQFLFSGLANNTVESIKSFEGIDLCWVEEAQTVSERSWEILIPTIRNDNSEIWVTFNPNEELDPTYQRFIVNTPPSAMVRRLNFYDNPWFPDVLSKEKDYLFSIDPEAAQHIWLGECRKVSNAQVLRGRYAVEPFEPRMDLWDGPYQGADWGFANDPTTLVRVWVYERTLYVEKEVYEIGTDIDMIPALFDRVPDVRKYMIRADSARPETISYMQRSGFRISAVDKWAGSVDDGVEHLRSYERIVIHPDCRHAIEEARLYSYKVDRLTGDVLPAIVDKHNHILDAIRYSLTPVIRGIIKKQAKRRTNAYKSVTKPSPLGWMAS